jgi:hypothetical protein
MSLWQHFLTNDRITHKWIHYFPAYERHLNRFIDLDVVFLEIGVANGGSLNMWRRFLGPYATVIGMDIDPLCRDIENNLVKVRIGSQSDIGFLDSIINEFGVPDVVIDDGSHNMQDINITFDYLYPKMPKNSVYIVEDLHTAYMPVHGGGYKNPNTFIEKSKDLIDQLNTGCQIPAYAETEALIPNEFSKTTGSMHFYDSLIVFEKMKINKMMLKI